MSSTKSSDNQILKLDTPKRVRVPKARREAILDEFERSGLSRTAFAKAHGIKYATFASWSLKRSKNLQRPTLAEIIVDAQPSSSSSSSEPRLHLPGGAWISLNDQPEHIQCVAQLLNALQA